MWFSFQDDHTGGSNKTKYEIIFIEALTKRDAKILFTNTYNLDPDDQSCECCGEDFYVSECEMGLKQAASDFIEQRYEGLANVISVVNGSKLQWSGLLTELANAEELVFSSRIEEKPI